MASFSQIPFSVDVRASSGLGQQKRLLLDGDQPVAKFGRFPAHPSAPGTPRLSSTASSQAAMSSAVRPPSVDSRQPAAIVAAPRAVPVAAGPAPNTSSACRPQAPVASGMSSAASKPSKTPAVAKTATAKSAPGDWTLSINAFGKIRKARAFGSETVSEILERLGLPDTFPVLYQLKRVSADDSLESIARKSEPKSKSQTLSLTVIGAFPSGWWSQTNKYGQANGEWLCIGAHVDVTKVKFHTPVDVKTDAMILREKGLVAQLPQEFAIGALAHRTKLDAATSIFVSGKFIGGPKQVGASKPALVWFTGVPNQDEVRAAQQGLDSTGLFTSKLFTGCTEYGDECFEFAPHVAVEAMEKSLKRKGSGTVEYRVLGTFVYSKEVMHAVLVAYSNDMEAYPELKELPAVSTTYAEDTSQVVRRGPDGTWYCRLATTGASSGRWVHVAFAYLQRNENYPLKFSNEELKAAMVDGLYDRVKECVQDVYRAL